jgi:hypothetical protein
MCEYVSSSKNIFYVDKYSIFAIFVKWGKMKLMFYPEQLDSKKEGLVQEFIRKVLKKHNDLRLRVEKFFEKVRESKSLDPFYKDDTIAPLRGILEMRIPKTRSGGVVRIYFCKHPKIMDLLVLLDAELKKDTEPSKVDRALERLSIFQENLGGCNVRRDKR